MFIQMMNSKKIFILCGFLLLLNLQTGLSASQVLKNQWGMVFVNIPAGDFKMGLEDYQSALMEVPEPKKNELKDELPQHTVRIKRPFFIAETEVTQQQWLAIMENKPGPVKAWQQENWKNLPVVSISWFMAARFVEEINKLDKQYRYRLPSEAEWEYVARSGINQLRPVPIESLEDYAWFINNSGDVPHTVGSRKPNAYGVYDMLGNAWEWVDDWYAPDTYKNRSNLKNLTASPEGPVDGRSKVRRGGSYHCPVHLIRPGYRAANEPGIGYEVIGFRLVAERK